MAIATIQDSGASADVQVMLLNRFDFDDEQKISESGMGSVRGIRESADERWWASQVEQFEEMVDQLKRYRLSSDRFKQKVRETFQPDVRSVLYGDALERRLQERFRAHPPVLDPIFRQRFVTHVGDEHPIKVKKGEGLSAKWQKVARLGTYTQLPHAADEEIYYNHKYGRRFDIALEDLINDDLNYFDRVAAELADGWRNTISYLQTSVFWGTTGANTSVYGRSDYGQMGVASLDFTIANLKTAIATVSGRGAGYRLGASGEMYFKVPRFIETGLTLDIDTREVLTSITVDWGGYTSTLPQPVRNAIADLGIVQIKNPMIDAIVTTGSVAQKCWALHCDEVPAGEQCSLRDHAGPELFMRASNAVRLGGGGEVNPLDGHFDDDSVAYKGRGFWGGACAEPRSTWASNGS